MSDPTGNAERMGASTVKRETVFLYRLFCADGHLLYIGITDSWERRRQQHAYEKAWWDEVAHVLLIPLDGRQEALAAESAAIRTERPRYNVVHVDLEEPEHYCEECTVLIEEPTVCLPCAWHEGFVHGKRFQSGVVV